jgi:hypothetical protein
VQRFQQNSEKMCAERIHRSYVNCTPALTAVETSFNGVYSAHNNSQTGFIWTILEILYYLENLLCTERSPYRNATSEQLLMKLSIFTEYEL